MLRKEYLGFNSLRCLCLHSLSPTKAKGQYHTKATLAVISMCPWSVFWTMD